MTREYARGPRGERVQGHVPRNRGTVTTMIGAMGIDGVRAMMTVEGATDAEVFEAFVTHLLVPKLKPGDIVVLDNVGAHKPEGALTRIRAAGARVLFLPPYSPDLNPIECCWSKVKAFLRKFEALTVASLDAAIAGATELITASDARGWFAHCGYSVQPE
jgi:transposase